MQPWNSRYVSIELITFLFGLQNLRLANVPLKLNSSGPFQTGTKLNFTSAALNGTIPAQVCLSPLVCCTTTYIYTTPHQNLTCQFLAGGLPTAIPQPLSNCSVPANMTGPLYVFVTNTSQPLANNIRDAATGTIVAGPAMIFVDNQKDALAMAARPGVNSTVTANGTSTTKGTSTTSASFAAPTTIILTSATPSPSTVMSSWTVLTTTISPSQASAIIASSGMPA